MRRRTAFTLVALLASLGACLPASAVIDNTEPARSDVLLETLTVDAASTTPVQTKLDFSPDVAYTMVITGTVRDYDQSRTDARPATLDAFYCLDCESTPAPFNTLAMKQERNFTYHEDRASEFKPIDVFIRGIGDSPEYAADHRYGIVLGDRLFYRPVGHLSFINGIPPRADRPASGSWTIEIWGKPTKSAAHCSLGEARESMVHTRDFVKWSAKGRGFGSRGRADFIVAPQKERLPLGSKRSFYGNSTGTTCLTGGGHHFEIVHLPENTTQVDDGPKGYKASFFFRIAESDDPQCPKGSEGLLELFDSRRAGVHDTARVSFDRPCTRAPRRITSGVTVSLPVRYRGSH